MTVFTLSSPDIPSGGTVPPHFEFDGFGCSGQNQSPILQWSGAPVGTQSFAVTVYDPDAPIGSGWWLWFVVDLPATTAQLVPNAGAQGGAGLPAGARQIRNDFGSYAWGGGGEQGICYIPRCNKSCPYGQRAYQYQGHQNGEQSSLHGGSSFYGSHISLPGLCAAKFLVGKVFWRAGSVVRPSYQKVSRKAT